MATYAEMAKKVLDWSNRDIEVLPQTVINDALRFAADEAYRKLKIPALEAIYTYEITDETDTLYIPGNLTEIIQLRKVDPNSLTGYVVYGAKSDVRSFYNEFTYKYDDFFFTREQNTIKVCPMLSAGDTVQLYYYGRQPAVDARYSIDTEDTDAATRQVYQYENVDSDALKLAVEAAEKYTSTIKFDDALQLVTLNDTDTYVLGKLAPNWLRDQNERILLFGALAESFDYLMEMDQSQIFRQKFYQEIDMLNQEDKMRLSRGGSVQTHFIAPLI